MLSLPATRLPKSLFAVNGTTFHEWAFALRCRLCAWLKGPGDGLLEKAGIKGRCIFSRRNACAVPENT
jgi:hypothetical protein